MELISLLMGVEPNLYKTFMGLFSNLKRQNTRKINKVLGFNYKDLKHINPGCKKIIVVLIVVFVILPMIILILEALLTS